jgi:hypothetical protein
MQFLKRHQTIAASVLGGAILLFAGSAGAQEGGGNHYDGGPIKVRIPLRLNLGDGGMTAIDPPSVDKQPIEARPSNDKPPELPRQPQRTSLGWDKTPKGYPIERFSDGSSIELRPECQIETLCNGTKIETLPTGTTIVRWPNGSGVVRNPDGSGAEFRPDPTEPSKSGDLFNTPGTIEVLPGGVVRQSIKDEGVVLDRSPDGTIKSRPDLIKPEAKTATSKSGTVELNTLPLNFFRDKVNVEMKNQSKSSTLLPLVKPSIIK